MQIRNATKEDLDKISEIEAICFPPEEKADKESLRGRLSVFSEHFWVLLDKGEIIGFINGMVINSQTIGDDMFDNPSLHKKDGDWQSVFGLDVLPEYRQKGNGEKLMHALIESAQKDGRKGCILTCKDHLVHYYEKFGYVNQGVSASTHGGATWYDMILVF